MSWLGCCCAHAERPDDDVLVPVRQKPSSIRPSKLAAQRSVTGGFGKSSSAVGPEQRLDNPNAEHATPEQIFSRQATKRETNKMRLKNLTKQFLKDANGGIQIQLFDENPTNRGEKENSELGSPLANSFSSKLSPSLSELIPQPPKPRSSPLAPKDWPGVFRMTPQLNCVVGPRGSRTNKKPMAFPLSNVMKLSSTLPDHMDKLFEGRTLTLHLRQELSEPVSSTGDKRLSPEDKLNQEQNLKINTSDQNENRLLNPNTPEYNYDTKKSQKSQKSRKSKSENKDKDKDKDKDKEFEIVEKKMFLNESKERGEVIAARKLHFILKNGDEKDEFHAALSVLMIVARKKADCHIK